MWLQPMAAAPLTAVCTSSKRRLSRSQHTRQMEVSYAGRGRELTEDGWGSDLDCGLGDGRMKGASSSSPSFTSSAHRTDARRAHRTRR